MERLPLTTRGYPLIIETKTFQQLHLIIPRESDCLDVMATIKMFAQPREWRGRRGGGKRREKRGREEREERREEEGEEREGKKEGRNEN